VIDRESIVSAVNSAFSLSPVLPPVSSTALFPQWLTLSAVVTQVALAQNCKVIGISGSQGSGKSTLAQILRDTLQAQEVVAAACSLDDFYLTRDDRARLARDAHPLLQTRGVPGTHDWQWLSDVLAAVQAGAGEVRVPQFDKALDDRSGTVAVDADMLVLEGWCLGVEPQPLSALEAPCNSLESAEDEQAKWRLWVNAQIADHYLALWSQVDLWVHLRVPGFTQVRQWRTQQEHQLPESSRMNSAQIERFIAHYERLTRWLWQQPAPGPGFVVDLDEAHNVVRVTAESSATFNA
jgi:D-glycerate 3-kinase